MYDSGGTVEELYWKKKVIERKTSLENIGKTPYPPCPHTHAHRHTHACQHT